MVKTKENEAMSLSDYRRNAEAREANDLPPLPLTADETAAVCQALQDGATDAGYDDGRLWRLLCDRVPPGADPAAKIKAEFLADAARGRVACGGRKVAELVAPLARMAGGYGAAALADLLEDDNAADAAARQLGGVLHGLDVFETVLAATRRGNPHARRVLEDWAEARWFRERGGGQRTGRIPLAIVRVAGEVNTDDLSPAREAPTRPDIPLHAQSMLAARAPGLLDTINTLRRAGKKAATPFGVALAADTLGTGSSRKSATNSLLWHTGRDMEGLPNKRTGGVALASRFAPIFRDTFVDAGGLPVTLDVAKLATGDRVVLTWQPAADGHNLDVTLRDADGAIKAAGTLPAAYDDAWRVGGRIALIIGRRLTARAREELGQPKAIFFIEAPAVEHRPGQAYTLAQKLVGRAAGRDGALPGDYVEPAMSTVGSQDTTGPMTRDELSELACLQFKAGLVMQSFCHTAAYPKDIDRAMHQSLSAFMIERGGVALKPGDGIIHSWLNRMLLPQGVGTGGDSHTRFPLGISFAAGSGLVAFAAAMGFMPLDMPESVRVRFSGNLRPGLTLRDAVNAVPFRAREAGLLDWPGEGAKNVFNGRILEIEGLDNLTVDEAFEFANASAERSAAAATVAVTLDAARSYVAESVGILEGLVADGYECRATLEQRIGELQRWLEHPEWLAADVGADYAATLDIDLSSLAEPLVACPDHPDIVRPLSAIAGAAVDEAFIGSCMTAASHFRSAARAFADTGAALGAKRLWIAPPTRLVRDVLLNEGVLPLLEKIGARIEIPGCSLCMGNQARVEDKAVVVSTSTRNFADRMGKGAKVYLASAEVAALSARLGRLPTVDEYFAAFEVTSFRR